MNLTDKVREWQNRKGIKVKCVFVSISSDNIVTHRRTTVKVEKHYYSRDKWQWSIFIRPFKGEELAYFIPEHLLDKIDKHGQKEPIWFHQDYITPLAPPRKKL